MSGLAAAGGEPRDLHTATITPEVSGTVTVDIAAGAAQDSSGNPSAAADQFSITANTAAPTVTITSSASEPVTGAFSIAVTFSEPVNGFELADLVVGNGNASGLQILTPRDPGREPNRQTAFWNCQRPVLRFAATQRGVPARAGKQQGVMQRAVEAVITARARRAPSQVQTQPRWGLS